MLSYFTTMTAAGGPQILATPIHQPSSPPITPDSGEAIGDRRGRVTPSFKRKGIIGNFYFSPLSDDGHSSDAHLRPSTPEHLKIPRSPSRPSTSSGPGDSPRRNISTPDFDSQSEASDRRTSLLYRRKDEFEFIIEEIPHDDPEYANRSGIIGPDGCSEVDSERAASPSHEAADDMVKRIQDLYFDHKGREEEAEAAIRRYRTRKNRRSTRSKRTWSESCGSEMDDQFPIPLNFDDVGSSAHRVKRRRSGLDGQAVPSFEDPPPERITEVDEPEDDVVIIDAPPPVDWSSLRDLPFYHSADPMAMDSGSAYSLTDDESNA